MEEHVKHAIDAGAVTTLVTMFLSGWEHWLPALLTSVWFMIRIYESKTVQGWIKRWRK